MLSMTAPAQERGPRALFPELPLPAPLPEAEPVPPAETLATPPVGVAPLPPPGLGARGLPQAEAALGAPLWPDEAPLDLAGRLARLPARVESPALHRLQRDLLLAPGPVSGAGADVVQARVERLLAMGEAAAAAELLTAIPDTPGAPGLDPLRAEALLAADEVEPGCALIDAALAEGQVRPEAPLVCAALRGEGARVDLGLALLRERGTAVDPLLVSLLGALRDAGRVRLREAPPADPLLLPLLRRAPLDPAPRAIADAAPAVRQAIAQNPNVPAGLAPPAAEPAPLPSYPGLAGQPLRDWRQALEAVPEARRPRWLAALDGLGAGPPDRVLADLPPEARELSGGRVDLAAWRALEEARAGEARGPILLAVLLLFQGRPAEVSPLALRAGVAALRDLGLEAEARAVAAAGIAGRAG